MTEAAARIIDGHITDDLTKVSVPYIRQDLVEELVTYAYKEGWHAMARRYPIWESWPQSEALSKLKQIIEG